MIRKDFILRLIEMFAEFLAKALNLIEKGDYDQAEKEIDQAYADFMQHEAAFFHSLSAEELTTDLIKNHNYTNHHLEILSELFYAEALLCEAKRLFDQSCMNYEKAYLLKKFLIVESKTFSFEKEQSLNEIQNKITELKS